MIVAIADTHAVLHYLHDDPELGRHASSFIEKAEKEHNRIGVSSISLLELIYLIKKGEYQAAALSKVMDEMADPSSVLQHIPVTEIIVVKTQQIPWKVDQDPPEKPKENKDPWDRVITATAWFYKVPLLTQDGFLKKLSMIQTIW